MLCWAHLLHDIDPKALSFTKQMILFQTAMKDLMPIKANEVFDEGKMLMKVAAFVIAKQKVKDQRFSRNAL